MGKTIGLVLLSYDVNREHSAVKTAMKQKGYAENWRIGQGPTYQLPNTTLWHENKSTDQAIEDIKIVCSNLHVLLEKAVAVKASEFVGV